MSQLRARQQAALRDTITRNAIALFAEHGYESVSVSQIADASMCSRSTFHRYFGTKEDVLFPGGVDVVSGFRECLSGATTAEYAWSSAGTRAGEYLARFLGQFDPQLRRGCMRLWFSEPAPRRRYLQIADEWELILFDYFVVSTAATEHHARFDCQLRASAITSACRAAMHASIDTASTEDDVRALVRTALDRFQTGFA